MPYRHLVLFDIDGTLLLTAGAGRRAILRAMADVLPEQAGLEQIRFDGKTDPQIVVELLEAGGHADPRDQQLIADVCRRYLVQLTDELQLPGTRLTVMPGISALLDAIEAEGDILLGLLTGNLAEGAALKLEAAGLKPSRFRVGAFGSDAAQRPDLPAIAARRAEPHFGRVPWGTEVVIIGDTPADVTCGRGIAARAIGVATGSYAVPELQAAGAAATFADLGDTARVLAAIRGY
jgi:phosphoglycolate phosphatase-like HAD superfamily hydrolase